MLSNSRILAQGIFGTNTVILLQADSSYLLVLGTYAKKTFTVLDQRVLTREEALQALEYIHTLKSHKEAPACTLLLDTPVVSNTPVVFLLDTKKAEKETETRATRTKVVVSPYFPTKEIFLATQMTCAPNMY